MHNSPASENGLPSSYFPLKKGTYWKYEYKGLPRQPQVVEIRILESKEVNGKTYFLFSDWFTLTRAESRQAWIAWSDGALYTLDGTEERQAISTGLERTTLNKSEDPVTVPGGNFPDTYTFQNCVGCEDAGNTYIFAKDVGIVSFRGTAIWGGASYELTETNANQSGSR